MNSSLTFSFVAALVPVSICLAYIFALRRANRPVMTATVFEYLTTGRGFSPEAHHSCTHPLL